MSMKVSQVATARLVRYHPPVGLSTLFRPIPKDHARPPLDVTYKPESGGHYLRFSAKAALGIPEQTLLLVLLELAQQQLGNSAAAAVLSATTTNEIGRELWCRLHPLEYGDDAQTLMLETSWYELNRRCGSQTGGSTQALREKQLERLCEVIIWEYFGDNKMSKRQSYLIALVIGNDDRMHIALNYRLARALLGKPYSQVSLAERLLLKRDVPMAIHAFLSTAIGIGHTLKIGIERLLERLWPIQGDDAPSSTHRSRRRQVKDGLTAIGHLDGWSVQWQSRELAVVTRCRLRVGDETCHIANKNTSYRQHALPLITREINSLSTFDASVLFCTSSPGPGAG